MLPTVRVVLAQVAPVFLDLERTIDKACQIIEEAAGLGADLIVFPETYLPAFPLWSAIHAPIDNHVFFTRLVNNSLTIDSQSMRKIASAAERHGIFVSIGFNESTPASIGCLWNSNAIFDDAGRLINHRRKLVPTFYEKLVWAPGDAEGLDVTETRLGKIGALICGENTNPLARYSLIAEGEQLHISTYPPIWPTHRPDEDRNYDLKTAIHIRAAAHAFEGKVFNLVVAGVLDQHTIDEVSRGNDDMRQQLERYPRGVSMVLDPSGQPVAMSEGEGEQLVQATIDLNLCIEPKQFHDVAGSYNRFDLFRLQLDKRPQRPLETLLTEPEHANVAPTEPPISRHISTSDNKNPGAS